MAQGSPMPGEKYLHFKKRMYQVIAIAYHSETMEKQVVYQALYGDFKIYVRPYDMFVSEVDHEKYPEVTQRYRFQYMADPTGEMSEAASAARKTAAEMADLKQEHPHKAGRQSSGAERRIAAGQETGARTVSSDAGEPGKRPEKAVRVLRADDAADRRRVAAAGGQAAGSDDAGDGEDRLNPWLEKFLDAENFEEKYKVVCDMQREVTDRLIDDIAVVMDLAIPDGDIKERYAQLLYCMHTRQRYEQGRLR